MTDSHSTPVASMGPDASPATVGAPSTVTATTAGPGMVASPAPVATSVVGGTSLTAAELRAKAEALLAEADAAEKRVAPVVEAVEAALPAGVKDLVGRLGLEWTGNVEATVRGWLKDVGL